MDANLIQFLVAAKKSTYAGALADSKKILTDGAREFNYANNIYIYRDRYYGSDPFAGEEVVFSANGRQAIWIMNYRGYTTDKSVSEGNIYAFLKQALREVTEAAPFRGPFKFKAKDYQYEMSFSGSTDSFVGLEVIHFQNRKVYELFFHGGAINCQNI